MTTKECADLKRVVGKHSRDRYDHPDLHVCQLRWALRLAHLILLGAPDVIKRAHLKILSKYVRRPTFRKDGRRNTPD